MFNIGTDIVALNRFDLTKETLIKHILTPAEYDVFNSFKNHQRKLEYIAGRFAGKEAYLKANHKGLGEISFQDIEILNKESGEPYLNDPNAKISISHEKEYCIAMVLIEERS